VISMELFIGVVSLLACETAHLNQQSLNTNRDSIVKIQGLKESILMCINLPVISFLDPVWGN